MVSGVFQALLPLGPQYLRRVRTALWKGVVIGEASPSGWLGTQPVRGGGRFRAGVNNQLLGPCSRGWEHWRFTDSSNIPPSP